MACLFEELKKLKQSFNGKFLITQEVKQEVIDKPMNIEKFQLESLRIQQLVDEGIFEFPASFGISDLVVSNETEKMMNFANNTYYEKSGSIKLIDSGEASCMALGKLLDEKGIKNILAVDERTMRSLCETPEELKNFLNKKFHTGIRVNKNNINLFRKFKIIRSVELIYLAYKNGFIEIKNKKLLESLVYALKFKGCSVSREEIDEIKKLDKLKN